MRRNSNRLKDYDYSQNGAYFITICTNDHQNHFGKVINGEVQLSTTGKIVSDWWYKIPEHFEGIDLDEFTVMPNHIHGIILIWNDKCGGEVISPVNNNDNVSRVKKNPSLEEIIAYYKYQSTKTINSVRNSSGVKFWQRGYYDHIIRNEKALDQIREYIRYNYIKWDMDRENLLNLVNNKLK